MYPKSHGLEQTLTSLPKPAKLPVSLPLTHLSTARWFDSMITAGKLEPRHCDVFKENLTYLFYGELFYRPNTVTTRNASELPIAFIFHPSLLRSVERYYPFDTGGLATGRFGGWAGTLKAFEERFKVSGESDYTVPSQMVYHLYQSNKRYLRGEVAPDLKTMPEPLPQLFEFLTADLSSYDVDHRQSSIEAHCKRSIPFDNNLLWVAFPEIKTQEFRPLFTKLYEFTNPAIPRFFPYRSHVIMSPREIASQLQASAYQDVVRDYVELPGGDDE